MPKIKQENILKALVVFMVGYAMIVGFLFVMQKPLMYIVEKFDLRAADYGLIDVQDIKIETSDHEILQGWYHAPVANNPVVLYLQSNEMDMQKTTKFLQKLSQDGDGFLMVAWRGYALSSGHPSEEGFFQDALAAKNYLKSKGVKHIVVMGDSLGAAVAMRLVATSKDHYDGLILDTPFESAVEIGQKFYPLIPISHILQDQYNSLPYLDKLNLPILILYTGQSDAMSFKETIAFRQKFKAPHITSLYYPNSSSQDLYEYDAFDDIALFLKGLK